MAADDDQVRLADEFLRPRLRERRALRRHEDDATFGALQLFHCFKDRFGLH